MRRFAASSLSCAAITLCLCIFHDCWHYWIFFQSARLLCWRDSSMLNTSKTDEPMFLNLLERLQGQPSFNLAINAFVFETDISCFCPTCPTSNCAPAHRWLWTHINWSVLTCFIGYQINFGSGFLHDELLDVSRCRQRFVAKTVASQTIACVENPLWRHFLRRLTPFPVLFSNRWQISNLTSSPSKLKRVQLFIPNISGIQLMV